MYHIKRDGGWLCKFDKDYPKLAKISKDGFITFAHAHKSKLMGCCSDCKKRYYEIIEKLSYPIILK